MDEKITISKPQLEAALLAWEQDSRDGKTLTHAEAGLLTVEQVAAESADRLWKALQPGA